MSNIFRDPNYLGLLYDESRRPTGLYPSKLVAEIMRREGVQHINSFVDIGCGRGDFLRAFAPHCNNVTGVDLSSDLANVVSPYNALTANLESDKLAIDSSSVDFIFSKSVIEHLHNPINVLSEINRILAPKGTAVIMTPSWEMQGWKPFYLDHTHVTPFTRFSLINILRMAGFGSVEVSYMWQLPLLWRWPMLTPLVRAFRVLPFKYFPMNPELRITKFNKFVRFSKEVMLIASVKKGGSSEG